MIDYHVHVVAHGEYSYEHRWLYKYLQTARIKGIKEIGFSEHDEFISLIDLRDIKEIQNEFQDIRIKLGLEVDYIPEREGKIKEILTSRPFDYVIGSVHFIDGWGFDHFDFKEVFATKDIDSIYESYFNLVKKMVKSGLFDIVGHIDLIKVWGHRPEKKAILDYIEPVLFDIKESGMVIEVNSSGLRKPVKELYPQKIILETIQKMNIPVTLSSDAHHPDELGYELFAVKCLLRQLGFENLATFTKRERTMIPLNIK